jgi:hypothetical protein
MQRAHSQHQPTVPIRALGHQPSLQAQSRRHVTMVPATAAVPTWLPLLRQLLRQQLRQALQPLLRPCLVTPFIHLLLTDARARRQSSKFIVSTYAMKTASSPTMVLTLLKRTIATRRARQRSLPLPRRLAAQSVVY